MFLRNKIRCIELTLGKNKYFSNIIIVLVFNSANIKILGIFLWLHVLHMIGVY